MFGEVVTDLMTKSSAENGRSIPFFAEKAINFIDKNGKTLRWLTLQGLDVEGIFRLSGSAKDIEKMKDQLDRGKDVELNGKDCHAIAGLLKLWLREMPGNGSSRSFAQNLCSRTTSTTTGLPARVSLSFLV